MLLWCYLLFLAAIKENKRVIPQLKITSWPCFQGSCSKVIFHWCVQILILSESVLALLTDLTFSKMTEHILMCFQHNIWDSIEGYKEDCLL